MALELLFSAPALADIANNIIASLLVDSGKFGVSLTTRRSLEEIYFKALKTCTEDFKPDVAKKLREAFSTSKINQKVIAFQQSGEIIPASFFENIFAPIVGKKSAPIYVKQFFANFRQNLGKEKALSHEIQLFYQEILFIHSQKHDIETQQLLRQILEHIKNPVSIEAAIGYQQIPPLPTEFVMPQAAIDRIRNKLEKKNAVIIYGSPGSGKSVIATVFAEQAEKSGLPVCWFRFKPGLTDKKVLMNTLLQFLHRETGSQENNLVNLLDQSRALFVFDDLHYITDKDLADAVYTISSIFLENHNRACTVMFTSREKSDFLPLHNMEWEHVLGLSCQEAENLVSSEYQLSITEKQLHRTLDVFENHPLFMNFFKQWFDAANPSHTQVDQYLSHTDQQDDRLQDYLMRELYDALGKSQSNENKLLFAVAFFRIPETRPFIESLYAELSGRNFSDNLTLMQKRKGLVKYLDDVERFDIHDVLREFYYQRLDQKTKWHNHCAKLYKGRAQVEQENVDIIEAAHHYRKINDHETAAAMLQPITHDCTVRGYYWQQLIHILERLDPKKISDDELRFLTLYDRGNLYWKYADWNAAIDDFNYCLKIQSQQEHFPGVFNSLGVVYHCKGDWDQAIRFYQTNLDISKKIGDVYGMALTYGNLGIVYKDKGDWDKAIKFYQKDLEMSKKLGFIHGMAYAYNNLGIVYQDKGDWDKAIRYFEQALQQEEIVKDINGMAQTFNNLGVIYKIKCDWNKAIKFYMLSLEVTKKMGDIYSIAHIYGNLGVVYNDMGDWHKAIQFYHKSLEISKKLGDIHNMAQTYNNLGAVYQEIGGWDKAMEFYKQAMKDMKKAGDIYIIAHIYGNIGNLYQLKEDWNKAIDFYKRDLEISEKLDDIHGMAQTYGNIGNVYQLKGDWDKALEFYQRSLEEKEKVGDVHGMAQTYKSMSLLYFGQKKYEEAILLHFEIVFLFAKLGAVPLVQQAGGILRNFQEQIGEYSFNKISEEVFNRIFEKGINWGRHKILSSAEAKEIWERLNL